MGLDVFAGPAIPESGSHGRTCSKADLRHDSVLELRRQRPLARHHVSRGRSTRSHNAIFCGPRSILPPPQHIEGLAFHMKTPATVVPVLATATRSVLLRFLPARSDGVGPRVSVCLKIFSGSMIFVNLRLVESAFLSTHKSSNTAFLG